MNLLDSIIIDDALLAFNDQDTFAEALTYVPRTGATRAIYGIIDREPAATRAEVDAGVAPKLVVSVQNHATYGISLTELQTGGDRILVKRRLGGTEADYHLLPMPSGQDVGWLTFRIVKG